MYLLNASSIALRNCVRVSFLFAGIANGYAPNVRYQLLAFSLQCFVTVACLVLAFVRLDLLQVSLLLFLVLFFAVVVEPPVIVQHFGVVAKMPAVVYEVFAFHRVRPVSLHCVRAVQRLYVVFAPVNEVEPKAFNWCHGFQILRLFVAVKP